tara:strand:+ start:4544 stop:4945 length:402 start_codon:yes stop_codon:yes gene_type:complete
MTDQFSKNKARSSTDKISVAAEYLNTSVSEVDGTLKTWNGSSHSKILPDDLEKIDELYLAGIEVEKQRLMRKERDERLAETDWIVTQSLEKGEDIPEKWKTYRQALRDLPSTSTPKLNEYKQLSNITWPTKPE